MWTGKGEKHYLQLNALGQYCATISVGYTFFYFIKAELKKF